MQTGTVVTEGGWSGCKQGSADVHCDHVRHVRLTVLCLRPCLPGRTQHTKRRLKKNNTRSLEPCTQVGSCCERERQRTAQAMAMDSCRKRALEASRERKRGEWGDLGGCNDGRKRYGVRGGRRGCDREWCNGVLLRIIVFFKVQP